MDNACSAPTKTDNGIMRFGAQDNGIMRFGAQDNGIMRLAPDYESVCGGWELTCIIHL